MRLKGSVTIEAAVIVPLFTMIFVRIVMLAIECHDVAIVNCASDKVCIEAEFIGYENGEYRADVMQELSEKVTLYLSEKTLTKSENIQLKEAILGIETKVSSISKNNPVEFVWITDAAKKLFQKE